MKNIKNETNAEITDDQRLLLRGSEAAALCGCSLRTWRLWDSLGYTPQPVHIGRAVFWKHKELVAWIDASCPRRDDWIYRKK